jgi:hypothetical protein
VTLYGLIFRLFGWLIGGMLVLGKWTFWQDGHVDATGRLAGVGVLILWIVSVVPRG